MKKKLQFGLKYIIHMLHRFPGIQIDYLNLLLLLLYYKLLLKCYYLEGKTPRVQLNIVVGLSQLSGYPTALIF